MILNRSSQFTISKREKQVVVVMAAFLIAHAVILFYAPLLPFVDLPNHLAEAQIYKYAGTAANHLDKYYAPVPWYYPNTFHTIFCSVFPTVEFGNKVFHVLYIACLQVALFLIIRHLKANQWYGLLGLIFTYNYNLTYGFVGFAISIPTILLLFYLILRDVDNSTWLNKFLMSILLILLYYMHAQNALFGLLLYGIITLFRYWPAIWKAVISGAVVSAPLLALIVYWWLHKEAAQSDDTLKFLLNYYTGPFWSSFYERARLVVFDHYSISNDWAGVIIGAFLVLLLIIPVIRFRSLLLPVSSFLRAPSIYVALLFVISILCFSFLPDKLPGQSPLYERFCTLVMLSLVLVTSVWLKEVPEKFIRTFACVTLVLYSFLWGEYIVTFNHHNRTFNKDFFGEAHPEGRLAGMIDAFNFRGRPVYVHFPNYFVVWKNGIASSKIIDYRFGVVRRNASTDILPFYHEYFDPKSIARFGYERVEYILIRGDLNLSHPIFKNFKQLENTGEWTLFVNEKQLILD